MNWWRQRGLLLAVLLLESRAKDEYCSSISAREVVQDNEGFGNQMHGIILAASIANVCNLTLKLSKEDRTGRICKRLRCNAEMVTNKETFDADYRVQYLPKIGVRCQIHPHHAHNKPPCRFRDPQCLTKLNVDGLRDPIRAASIRKVFDVQDVPFTPICSDGPRPKSFDVAVHFRAINDQYERRSSVQHVHFNPNASETGPPFNDIVRPLAEYIETYNLSKSIFLAANLPDMRDLLVQRFRDQNIRACYIDLKDSSLYRHAMFANNCGLCDDVTFSEWAHLAQAKTLLAQIGLHCDGDCLDPTRRKFGWRSSFSYTAATYADVPTVFLDDESCSKGGLTLERSASCRAPNTATIGLTAPNGRRWITPKWQESSPLSSVAMSN